MAEPAVAQDVELELDTWHPSQASLKTIRALKRCTMGSYGIMADTIGATTYRETDLVSTLKRRNRLIGWAIKKGNTIMVHVYKSHRRKGYGSLLVNAILREQQIGKRPRVYHRHSDEARAFWKKMKQIP